MITNKDIMKSRQLAGRVERWHTWPMIRKPTGAEHQCRVATLYVELFGPEMPRAEVLYYCLVHDMGELRAGDTPYGAKHLVPELGSAVNTAEVIGLRELGIVLPELMPVEWTRFKVCDLLEMFETAVVEWNMGNRYAAAPMESCVSAVLKLSEGLPPSDIAEIGKWIVENNVNE